MLRVLVGFIAGVYVTQNYTAPDMKLWAKFIQQTLVSFEKDLPKKDK